MWSKMWTRYTNTCNNSQKNRNIFCIYRTTPTTVLQQLGLPLVHLPEERLHVWPCLKYRWLWRTKNFHTSNDIAQCLLLMGNCLIPKPRGILQHCVQHLICEYRRHWFVHNETNSVKMQMYKKEIVNERLLKTRALIWSRAQKTRVSTAL
jgi:hypothetical protein